MAAQTVANLGKVLKEVYTQDNLEKQFYAETPWLDRLEKTDKYTIGRYALVPLHKGRGGSSTTLSAAGGNLNPADAQRVDTGQYAISYNYNPIKVEFGALNQASGGATSVVDALDLEVSGALSDIRKDITRQALGAGDALIAQCDTTSSSTTVNLLASGYGYDAIVRGWLREGQTVDIGTTANEAAVVADATITAVGESPTAPTITISSSVTTSTSHYVSIANARSGTNSNEMIGLRTIAGSSTSIIGGIDPATNPYWKPAKVDTSTTVINLDLPLSLQQAVFQKTGKFPTFALTSIKQLTNLYSLLQNQVRFTNDVVTAGNVLAVEWNGMRIEAQPDVPDREFYMITPDALVVCTGKYAKPTWMSEVQGTNAGLIYQLGATNFQDTLAYALGLAVRRRNSHAAAVGLTA
jgi:hypothetical protein